MRGSDQLRTYRRTESVVFLKTDEPFGGLSNMAGGYPIHVNGLRIHTSEALYQVCRFPHLPEVQRMIIGQFSPMTAKMRSKPYRKDSRLDWDQVRVRIMRWCLRMKLANNWSTFSELLLRTAERPIVEESRKDAFWGAKASGDGSTLVGMNVLGRLLMELREQVKQQGREAMLDVAPPQIPQFLLLGRPIEVVPGSASWQAVADHEQGSLFSPDTATNVQPSAPRVEAAAYPNYRMSGLPWVPQIPENWQVLRNGRLFGHRVETGFPDLPILEVSLRTGVRVRDMENLKRKQVMSQKEKYKRALKDDLAYNMMRMWQGAVGPAPVDGLVSPAYVVVKPYNEANSSYYSYLFRTAAYTQEVNKFSRGIVADRNRLYWESFKQMPSLVPPRPEQDQIVAYLRAQDAHISRFIKAKRELIALMAEQRGVLAEQAISSSETQHLRLDRVVSLLATPIIREPEVTYTPIGMFNRGRGIFHKPPTEGKHLGDSTFFRIEEGSLIFSGQFAWEGAVAVTSAEDDGCIASHRYPIAKCKRDAVTPEYLYTFFLSKAGDLILNHHSRGAAGRNRPLNPRSLLKEKIPVPPLYLQREVSNFYYEELAVRQEIEKEIALIREYRDRLIADVVTGQVDVRGWQPGPDDVVDDTALAALRDDSEDVTEEEDGDGDGED